MAGTMIDSIIMKIGADISAVQTAYASMRGLTQQSASNLSNLQSAAHNLNVAAGNTWKTMQANPLSAVAGAAKNAGQAILSFGQNVAQPIYYLKNLAQSGANFVTNLFAQNAAMEQTKIAFTGMLGSGTAAQEMLDNLEKFAAATPFEFPELAQSSRLLIAMGFAASDVIPIMRNVGDTVAGLGGGSELIQRIVYSMGQMKSAGRVTGEEMRELAIAGVPAWQWLAKAIGTDVPTAMKRAQNGTIDVDVALKALQTGMSERFGGQMANQARTFNGLLSTMKDNVGMALRSFLGPAFEAAKGGLMTLTDLMGSPKVKEFATQMGVVLGQALKIVADVISRAIPMFMNFVNALRTGQPLAVALAVALGLIVVAITAFKIYTFIMSLVALGTAMWGAATAAWGFAAALLANPITWIVLAIVAAVALIIVVVKNWGAISTWLIGVWNNVKGFFMGFWNAIVGAWNAAIAWLANLLAPVVAAWNGFVGWLRGIWNGILGFLQAVWNAIKMAALVIFLAIVAVIIAPFLPLILLIRAHWTQIQAFLTAAWNTIRTVASAVWNAITGAISTAVNVVRTVVVAVWTAISGWITERVNYIRNVITVVWNAISFVISSVLNTIRGIVTSVWNTISGVISSVLNTIWGIISGTWNRILGTIRGILGTIWSTISGIFNNIRNTIAGVLSNIWSTITGWAGSIWNALTAPFRNAVDAVAGFMANIWQQVRNAPVIGGVVQFLGGAQGVTNWAGGPLWVGEQGRELLWLPKGSDVTPHGQSEQIAASASSIGTPARLGGSSPGVVNVFLQIDGRTLIQALGEGFAEEIRIQVGGAH